MGLDRVAWYQEWGKITPARLKGEITDAYEMLSLPAQSVNPDVDKKLIHEAVKARLAKFAKAVIGIDHSVLRTLHILRKKGKKLGLVSNADTIEIASWHRSPLNNTFDTVIFSCQVGLVKPDRKIYLRACNDLGIRPSECLFVGDGGSEEFKGAQALGMTTVQMTGIIAKLWPEVIEEGGRYADSCIDSIESLIDAL